MRKFRIVIIAPMILLCLGLGNALADGKVSIRVNGGWTYISGGDVNPGTQAWFDRIGTSWVKIGRYQPVHNGVEFGGDLIFELTPRLGLGIGVGFMRFSRLSSVGLMTEEPSIWDGGAAAKPKLSALPIRAGVYLTVPWKKSLNVLVNAGVSYYYRSRYSDEWIVEIYPGPSYDRITTRAEYKKAPIGFQGGIGLEYELKNHFFIFLEARGRYARFRGWKGTSVFESDHETPFSEQGILYYEVVPALTDAPRLIMVQGDPPDGPDGEPRQAVIDFSGINLEIGFRIRL